MSGEFSSLLDLALAKGAKHSEILGRIHDRLLTEYKRRYPRAPISTVPVVAEDTGEVHFVSEGKDITPPEFKNEAESLSRQVIIEYLASPASHVPPVSVSSQINLPSGPQYSISGALFWVYNIIFSIYNFFLGLAFLPYFFSSIPFVGNLLGFSAAPITMIFAGLLLLLTPYASIFFAVRGKLYRNPGLLGKILFLGELPLVILTLPILFISSLPPSVGWLWFFGLTFPFVLVTAEEKGALSRWGLLIRSAGFAVTLYISLLFLFFVPLFVVEIVKAAWYVTQSIFVPSYNSGPFMGASSSIPVFSFGSALTLLLSILGLLGACVLILLPFVMPIVFGILVHRALNAVIKKNGARTAALFTGVPLFMLLFIFLSTFLSSPGQSIVRTLATFDQAGTFREKMEKASLLSGKEKEIQTAVASWKTAATQYPLKAGDTWLSTAYKNQLFFPEILADGIEQLFYVVASPFVYRSDNISEQKLYDNYLLVFGVPYGTTPAPTSQGSKNVSIVTRTITAATQPASLFATVTYEEEYRNETNIQQEVVYEFSLPPDAVVTDLDLGPDFEFQGQISPRGAARRTYQQQVTQRRDPALIEQVGPRQYRIRVFPIPARFDNTTLGGRNQKVRFTYITPVSWNGIPLPRFSKKQNMTELNLKQTALVNGKEMNVDQDLSVIPDTSERAAFCNGQISFKLVHVQDSDFLFGSDDRERICNGQGSFIGTQSDQRLALVVDTSAGNAQSLNTNIEKLFAENTTFLNGGMIDLYYANSNGVSDVIPLSTQKTFVPPKAYFGLPPTLTDLQQLPARYDGVILLTGGTQPIHSDATDERGVLLKQPVFVYHLYGQIPTYPDDVTTSLLTSGGMVVDSLADAYFRLPTRRKGDEIMKNGWFTVRGSALQATAIQTTSESNQPVTVPEKRDGVSPEEAIAAKYSIYSQIQRYPGGDLWSDIPQLDKFNIIAQRSAIVSPFSSSIALVNTLQELQLQQQNQNAGRYETEALPTPIINPWPVVPTFNGPALSPFGLNSGINMLGGTSSFVIPNPEGVGRSYGDVTMPAPARFTSGGFGLFTGNGLLDIFILVNILVIGGGIILAIPKLFIFLKKRPSSKKE